LNNRAGDLTSLKDGMGQAVQTLKAADKGLEALTTLVQQAKTLGEQAQEASTQISRISSLAVASTTNSGATFISAAYAAVVVSTSSVLTIAVTNGGTTNITYSTTNTIASIVTAISAADTGITASYNVTSDRIEITASAGVEVTLSGTSTFATQMFTMATTTFGSTGTGTDVGALEADFEKVMGEINKIYQDAGYKGINLINGTDLTVTTNENSTTIVINSVTLNVTGLNFTAATVDWTVAANIDTSIAESKLALATLRTTASNFGTDLGLLQNRESFTSNLIETLEAGAGLLINANLEEESANLLALQTRQALGTSALSFANQSQQSILQLFR
jgi:flagellin-like hook-associated protein FlgL